MVRIPTFPVNTGPGFHNGKLQANHPFLEVLYFFKLGAPSRKGPARFWCPLPRAPESEPGCSVCSRVPSFRAWMARSAPQSNFSTRLCSKGPPARTHPDAPDAPGRARIQPVLLPCKHNQALRFWAVLKTFGGQNSETPPSLPRRSKKLRHRMAGRHQAFAQQRSDPCLLRQQG